MSAFVGYFYPHAFKHSARPGADFDLFLSLELSLFSTKSHWPINRTFSISEASPRRAAGHPEKDGGTRHSQIARLR
jgi:hypothetical protein